MTTGIAHVSAVHTLTLRRLHVSQPLYLPGTPTMLSRSTGRVSGYYTIKQVLRLAGSSLARRVRHHRSYISYSLTPFPALSHGHSGLLSYPHKRWPELDACFPQVALASANRGGPKGLIRTTSDPGPWPGSALEGMEHLLGRMSIARRSVGLSLSTHTRIVAHAWLTHRIFARLYRQGWRARMVAAVVESLSTSTSAWLP